MSKPARINELAKQIEYHSAKYYSGQAEISDDAFDALRDELEELDPNHPLLSTVGSSTLATGWDKAKHKIHMGSQAKVNSADELRAWSQRIMCDSYVVEHKLDGLSIDLEYENGSLVKAITRGDGVEGEEITRNAVKFQGVAKHLPVGITGSIRCEVILPISTFNSKYAGEYKNPRNAASGLARRLDGKGSEDLRAVPFNIVVEGRTFKTEFELLGFMMERCGLSVVKFYTRKVGGLNADEVVKIYEAYEKDLRDKLDYEIDGLVIKVNDLQTQEDLGITNDGRPRGQIALKFASRKKVTYVVDVEWESGNTGRITPVAILKPVNLSGVTVSRVTCHNLEQFEKLGLYRGAPVLVSRANDVIPYIHGIVDGIPPMDVDATLNQKAPTPVKQVSNKPKNDSPWF